MILLVNLETTNGIVRSSSILRISIIRILSVVIFLFARIWSMFTTLP